MTGLVFLFCIAALFAGVFSWESQARGEGLSLRPAGLLSWVASGNWPAKVGAGLLTIGTGAWGLGENVVQGMVDPDEFYVFKPAYRAGKRAVLRRSLGTKEVKMVYGEGGRSVHNLPTSEEDRRRYCVSDPEALELAGAFHGFYRDHRVVDDANLPLSRARLRLVQAVQVTLRQTLGLLGVRAPDSM